MIENLERRQREIWEPFVEISEQRGGKVDRYEAFVFPGETPQGRIDGQLVTDTTNTLYSDDWHSGAGRTFGRQ